MVDRIVKIDTNGNQMTLTFTDSFLYELDQSINPLGLLEKALNIVRVDDWYYLDKDYYARVDYVQAFLNNPAGFDYHADILGHLTFYKE